MSPQAYMCPTCEKFWASHELKTAEDMAKIGKYVWTSHVYCPVCHGVAYWVLDLKARAERYTSLYELYVKLMEKHIQGHRDISP